MVVSRMMAVKEAVFVMALFVVLICLTWFWFVKLLVPVRNAAEAIELKQQIDAVYADFTWRYTPQVTSWLGDEIYVESTVEFDFADESMISYFQLKWAEWT